MNRYKKKFNSLKLKEEIAFVPFTVLDFPKADESFEIIKSFIDNGADMLELAIPYSDPLADGPIIQKASFEAIQNGSTTKTCLQLLSKVRSYNSEIPIGLLVYAQIIYAYGIEKFFIACKEIQIDSVLIADLPFLEKEEFQKYAKLNKISLVFILAPNIPLHTAIEIQKSCEAYVYVVKRSGITGHDNSKSNQSPIRNEIKEYQNSPHLLGFGISNLDHIQKAIHENYDGVIVGSKIISLISEFGNGKELKNYLKDMKKATKRVRVPEKI